MSVESVSLQLALDTISECYEELVDRAQLLVDGYWSEWRKHNKMLFDSGLKPGQKEYQNTGRLAPRLKRSKVTHRVYIEWLDWKKTTFRKFQNPRSGVQIKPNKREGYTWKSISKKANAWEKKFFDKYEPLFKTLRKALAVMADQITMLKSTIKLLS
ncbi:conjugative transfer protein MobI(A/C) [Shewanella frigidimarina]|uniref:conjugative transfer protein MobI(A/C) n=1 Tax=Shewanella frigidimarina TaxID=56812 RepID=UPI003D7BC82D